MKTRLPVLIFVALLMACATPADVITDYDNTVDFSQYRTFRFYEWEPEEYLSPLDKNRIEEAVKNELERRGILHVDSQADLLVSMGAVMELETDRRALPEHHDTHRYFGYHFGFGPRFPWGAGYTSESLRDWNYEVGALIIDVFDARREELIWEGVGNKVIDRIPEQRQNTIPAAVNRLMLHFPVKPIE
jgi:hypothetical protein